MELPVSPEYRTDRSGYGGDIEGMRLPYIWLISITAALGGLLFGYDWVVIGGSKPFYEAYFGITNPALSGWCVSSALVGCIVGAPIAGVLSEWIGRKRTLLLSALFFIGSAAGVALSESIAAFVAYRILGGVGIGLAASMSPVYIAEVSPPSRRGRMVAIYQLMIVIGIVSAQLINLLIAEPSVAAPGSAAYLASWNVQTGWRAMFAAQLVPAIAFAALMLIVPESPRWLYLKGRHDAARTVLAKMGSPAFVEKIIADVRLTMLHKPSAAIRISDFSDRDVLRLLIIGAVLPAYGQWSGINIIFNYASDVFMAAGFSVDTALQAIVSTGSISLIATLFALRWVETLGRRLLLLSGSASLALLMAAIGLAYAFDIRGLPVLFLILAAIFCYSVTLGPVIWVLLSEIFPGRIRGAAMGISTFVLWTSSFLLTFSYPFILHELGVAGSFMLYGAISAFGFWFIHRYVRETRGRSLEQLESDYGVLPAGVHF